MQDATVHRHISPQHRFASVYTLHVPGANSVMSRPERRAAEIILNPRG